MCTNEMGKLACNELLCLRCRCVALVALETFNSMRPVRSAKTFAACSPCW